MAYSCKYQNEVQSAFFSRQTINLFTVASYDTKGKEKFLIVTHPQDQGKNSCFTFMMKVVDEK